MVPLAQEATPAASQAQGRSAQLGGDGPLLCLAPTLSVQWGGSWVVSGLQSDAPPLSGGRRVLQPAHLGVAGDSLLSGMAFEVHLHGNLG